MNVTLYSVFLIAYFGIIVPSSGQFWEICLACVTARFKTMNTFDLNLYLTSIYN